MQTVVMLVFYERARVPIHHLLLYAIEVGGFLVSVKKAKALCYSLKLWQGAIFLYFTL